MWWIPTKKEVKKEFDKIKDSFKNRDNNIKDSFKERDEKIEKLREKLETNSLKIATLEGAYLVLSSKSQQSQVSHSLKQSQGNFETRLIQRIRKSKKSLVMAEILKLQPSYSVIEMFEKIVKERGLCSKASFYRYIASLKSQKLSETETKIETYKGKKA